MLLKWGDIPPFRCDQPGFEDVSVRPKIAIQVVKKEDEAHYKLHIMKVDPRKEEGKLEGTGRSGVSHQNEENPTQAYKGSFNEFDVYNKIRDSKFAKYLAEGERKQNIDPAYQRDRGHLERVLTESPAIFFKENSDELENEAALMAAAGQIADLRKLSALSHLHRIEVHLTPAQNEERGIVFKRFQKVVQALRAAGVRNPLSAKEDGNGQLPRSATFRPAPDTEQVREQYFARWDRYTVAHEFGHMIGLLDEYDPAVSPQLITKMIGAGQLPVEEAQLSKYAQEKKEDKEAPQTAYADLLTRTGLTVPNWARPSATEKNRDMSTSLMSGGFEVLRQHHVTFWEVLVEMTKDYVDERHWKV